jgi:hypothetical protein
MLLLKVENFELQNFFQTENLSANHILQGRDYFAGLRVTKRDKATGLLILTLLQIPTLTITLILTLT